MSRLLCAILAGLLAAAPAALGPSAASARVFSPRVVSERTADAWSMKTFADFPRWRDLNGDARAWEIYKYLADTRTGLFHMNEVLEGDDVLHEYRNVRDPVKIINVYGYAYCAILGPVMAGVCEGVGLGKARTITLPAWHHVACEVFYDGGWHYLDLDLRAAFRRPDGSLASLAEARRDPSLWTGRGPLFFPNDPLEATRRIYAKTPVEHYHGFHWSGHTMDYVLRQGESFVRYWKPQGGRWHHDPKYNQVDWLRRLLEQEPRGPKPNHRHFTVHNYGNGRFVYEPDLTDRATDFDDGVYDAHNVRPAAAGLTLARAGRGEALFAVRSPYVIVPLVGEMDTTDDDREAAMLEIDAAGVVLGLSLDHGLTWQEIGEVSGPRVLDLTRWVAGRYGYLLKLVLSGKPGQAVVRRLKLTTWVQVAPASLPAVHAGVNVFEYRTNDHHGLPTRVKEIQSNASRPEGLLEYLVAPPEDYDPARTTSRIRGTVMARVDAPPGTRIAWLSAGGSFRTHQGDAARNTRNSMALAEERPEGFREIYRAAVPPGTDHWHYNADREVRLERPARTVYVRYVGDPAVNNIRIYAHCLEARPRRVSPVVIRHVWTETGRQHSHEVRLEGPGRYQITAGERPQSESLEIAVPSRRRPPAEPAGQER